jgi:hypothetical protein
MTVAEEIVEKRYELLWTSLRQGYQKILDKIPNDSGAKTGIAYMDLMESLVNCGEDLIKALEKDKANQEKGGSHLSCFKKE